MRTSLIWSAISCHILWIRHIKCAPLQRHVKITILPFTVTNLRILSKSSFKNTHLGVSSPASVADTLQNKKKRTKLTGRFLVAHFFGQGQNEDGTIFRSQSRPVTPFPGPLFFSSAARWKIRKPSSLCLLREAILKYLNNHCLYIFGIKWCFKKINRLTIHPNSI